MMMFRRLKIILRIRLYYVDEGDNDKEEKKLYFGIIFFVRRLIRRISLSEFRDEKIKCAYGNFAKFHWHAVLFLDVEYFVAHKSVDRDFYFWFLNARVLR